MLNQTVHYRAGSGWNAPLPAALDSDQTLVLAFAAADFTDDDPVFADLVRAFPKALHLGCSTAGEIAGPAVHDASVVVAIVRFDHTRLQRAATSVESPADSFAAGARHARQLAGPGLRAVFLLSDGLGVNGTPLVGG